MTRRTVLLLLLLLVNAWLLATTLGAFGPGMPLAGWLESPREPERLGRQLRADEIRIVSPIPASQPAAAPPAHEPAQAASAPAAATAASSVVAAASGRGAGLCLELGGFSAAQLRRASADLATLESAQTAPTLKVARIERRENARWWVRIASLNSREEASRAVAELNQQNVTDLSLIGDEAQQTFTISLGLFRDRERAQRHLNELRDKGVSNVVMSEDPRSATRTWLRVEGATTDTRDRLGTLKDRYRIDELSPCRT
jgi:hypothetical protein